MNQFDADTLAAELADSHRNGRAFEPIDPTRLQDLTRAYDVQDRLVERLCTESGSRIAGYKVGLTSPTMQRMCGIDTPIGGAILAKRVVTADTVEAKNFGRLGLEFEFGIRIGRELSSAGQPYTLETIADAIDGVCVAVELVDDRHADYAKLDARSLVADNSWNAGAILGPFQKEWPGLAAIEGIVSRDGGEIGRGFGRDLMGHPLAPLVWLANHMAARGKTLARGDVVLTGNLIQTQFPKPGQVFDYVLAPLGFLSFRII